MIDIFMLVVVIVLSLIIIGVNIYLLAYYCTTDDNDFKGAIVLKITAVLGMFIGLGQVCLLPLDVSNTRGNGGEFRMDLIWQITYLVIVVFVFVIIPLEIAIYECDPDWTLKQKFWNSFCFFFGEVLVVAILFIATFFIFNKVHIPVASKQCPIDLTMSQLTSSHLITDEDEIIVYAKNICYCFIKFYFVFIIYVIWRSGTLFFSFGFNLFILYQTYKNKTR